MSLRAYEADFANSNEAAMASVERDLLESRTLVVRAGGDMALRGAAQDQQASQMPAPHVDEPFRNKGVEPIYECPGYSLAYSPSR